MSDLLENVISGQDPLKKILAKIPGFQGYIERQSRRDADKLLRETIAREFDALWQRISHLQNEILDQGGLAYMDDLEVANIQLRTFIDRVRNASYGHSSLFDAIQINEKQLALLYEFDAALLGLAEEVGSAIDNVEAAVSTEGLAAAIRNLTNLAAQCVATFDKRRAVIVPVSAGSGSEASSVVES